MKIIFARKMRKGIARSLCRPEITQKNDFDRRTCLFFKLFDYKGLRGVGQSPAVLINITLKKGLFDVL